MAEVYSKLIDISFVGAEVVFVEVEIGKAQRRNVLDDPLVVGYKEHFEVQVFVEFFLLSKIHMKFLLKNTVSYSIMHRNDKTILLLQEPFVGLPKITIPAVFHVEAAGVVEPSRHGHLVVEQHHLRKNLFDGFLGYFFFEVPAQLHKIIIHCQDLTH